MNSYYCKRLYEEINFDAEDIYVCCGMSLGPSFPIYSDKEKSIKKWLNKLLKWRKKCSVNAYRGIVSDKCKNCIELEERNISFLNFLKSFIFDYKKFPVKNIIIKSFRQCEFSCVYCLEKRYTQGKKTVQITKSEFYDILPIIKTLINTKMIDKKGLRLEFQGGSISVWDEFKDVLKEVVNYGVGSLFYHTNAVSFIPEIGEAAKSIPSDMCVAIDSGSRETFKKVKGEDKYDTVLENIIRYVNSGINITIKYIIVKKLNDNIEEIQDFCKTIKYIAENSKHKDNIHVMLDLDFREYLNKSSYKFPDEYVQLYKYVIDFCNKNNIDFIYRDLIKNMLE